MAETVFSLGSILVDVTLDVPGLPERGADVLATGTRSTPGGGFNLAAAVARQGVRCVYAGPHGTGRHGDLIRAGLADEGITPLLDPRPDGDSGFCVTLVEPDGERTFVTMAGVEGELTADDLARLRPRPGDMVSVSGYDLLYPGSGPALAGWLPSVPAGVGVALDPGPLVADIPPGRLAALLDRLTVLTMNEREARLLSGVTPAPSTLVVTRRGAAGCTATRDGRTFRAEAPEVTAVDTTGAGDAHTGVLLAALVTGHDVGSALRLATEAAAVAVTRAGPATAPTVLRR